MTAHERSGLAIAVCGFAILSVGDAVIKGIGSSSDGRSKSVYAPVPSLYAQALIVQGSQARFTGLARDLIRP